MNGHDPVHPAIVAWSVGMCVDCTIAYQWEGGLTKRELFAAMALQGLNANPDPQVGQAGNEGRAKLAVASADALLAALEALPSQDHGPA